MSVGQWRVECSGAWDHQYQAVDMVAWTSVMPMAPCHLGRRSWCMGRVDLDCTHSSTSEYALPFRSSGSTPTFTNPLQSLAHYVKIRTIASYDTRLGAKSTR